MPSAAATQSPREKTRFKTSTCGTASHDWVPKRKRIENDVYGLKRCYKHRTILFSSFSPHTQRRQTKHFDLVPSQGTKLFESVWAMYPRQLLRPPTSRYEHALR